MINKFLCAMFITFSLGSLPGEAEELQDLGGFFVVGIHDSKPEIKSRITPNGILITMFEY